MSFSRPICPLTILNLGHVHRSVFIESRMIGKSIKILHKAEAKFSIIWYQNASKMAPKCSPCRDLSFYVCSRMVDRKKVSGPICGLMRPRPLFVSCGIVSSQKMRNFDHSSAGHQSSGSKFRLKITNFCWKNKIPLRFGAEDTEIRAKIMIQKFKRNFKIPAEKCYVVEVRMREL
jgi:hypothetical protein